MFLSEKRPREKPDRMIINYQSDQGVKECLIPGPLKDAILCGQQAISRTPGSEHHPETVMLVVASSPLLTQTKQWKLWGRFETSLTETARPSLLFGDVMSRT